MHISSQFGLPFMFVRNISSEVLRKTFKMSQRPVIAIPSYSAEGNLKSNVPPFTKDIASPHFQLVTEDEFSGNPDVMDKIVGVLSHPGWQYWKPEYLDKFKNLKVVSTVSAGYNHLDLEYLKKRSIRVGYTPGVLNDSVADSAFALILCTARKVRKGIEVAMGDKEITAFPNHVTHFGNDVTGKTLGIVGMGNIGLEVAKRAVGFRMKIVYHNRNKRSDDSSVNAQYYSSLDDMLPLCDFVLIACALTEQTTHLFTAKQFKLMKNTSTIINVSRGPIIQHYDLAEAIKNGDIQAAGLDVTDPEPLPRNHPLLKLDGVTILPHLGSQTIETRTMMFQRGFDNLKAVLLDNTPMPSELVF